MVCYAPGTGTLAVIGFAVYLIWHKAILRFVSMAGTTIEIILLLGAAALAAFVLVWTARMIRRRRAQAGACTTCRFRCQEALKGRPNLLVNRVDRRVTPPAVARRAALTCHPAAPLLSPLLGRLLSPAVPLLSRRAYPALAAPAASPAPRPAPQPAPGMSRPASAAARPAVPAGASTPAPTPSPSPAPAPAAPPRPAPAHAAVPARQPWPLAPRPVVREPARPVETVPFDGYVLTPDGVDGQPAPAPAAAEAPA